MKKINYHNKINIQNQLLSRFFVILLGLLVVLSIYENRSLKNYIYKSKAEDLNQRILNIDKNILIKNSNENINTNYIFEKLGNEVKTEDVSVLAISDDGEIQFEKKSNTLGEIIKLKKTEYLKMINNNDENSGYKILNDYNDNEQIVVWRLINIQDDNGNTEKGLIQISALTDASKQIFHNQVKMFIIAASFILFVGIVMAYTVSKYTLRPLKEITRMINEFDTEKINERIDINTKQQEIVILQNSFNNMLEKVESARDTEKKLNNNMRRFIMDASHEIRTPLTAIRGFIEVLELGAKDNKEKLQIALKKMYKETERLTRLVNNLLIITKIEGNIYYEVKDENVANIINDIREQLFILKGNRKLILNLNENIYLNVNKDHIKQLIYNLIQNAINHTDKNNGVININLSKDKNNYIIIEVCDNGEGISKENIDKVFDRFFRSKNDRHSNKEGYGLGLSIVKSIVDRYNGKISVESTIGKGTSFIIVFKK